MTKADRVALACAAALLGVVCLAGRATGQELSAEAKDKAAAEARAKRNALAFEDNATTIVFYDRAGKRTGGLGERALYGETVVSPDGSRVAVVKNDLPSETADLFIVDIATGTSTRLTTSARTEFVMAPVWSPDSNRIAYVTIRKGQEAIYVRPSNGQGSEEVLYKNPGAFMDLSDWSLDGRFLTFAVSDLSGGTLFTLPLDGGADRSQPKCSRRICVCSGRNSHPTAASCRTSSSTRRTGAKCSSGRSIPRPWVGPGRFRMAASARRSGGATARSSTTSRATRR